MNAIQEFTPELMYVDQKRIDALIKSADDFTEKINSRFRIVESLLEETLPDKELLRLAKEGIPFLNEKLKDSFQFKNASMEFNLEAMGKTQEYEAVRKTLMNSTGFITAYDFEILKGTTKLTNKGQKAIVESNTHCTKNEAQNRALKLAERMVKNLNEAMKEGWVGNFDVSDIERGNSLVTGNSTGFTVHYQNISLMTPNGSIRSLI